MRKIIIMLVIVMIGICIYADETASAWDINTVKLRKQSLFGWNYYQGYDRWFGIKGSGMGLDVGYLGVVWGFNTPINENIEFFLDSYVYADLSRMMEYGFMSFGNWLYWEISLWWGDKSQ